MAKSTPRRRAPKSIKAGVDPKVVVTPEQVGTGGTRNRVRQQDWDDNAKPVVKLAGVYFKILVLTDKPCPTPAEADEFATEVWFFACKESKVKMELTPPVISTVRA